MLSRQRKADRLGCRYTERNEWKQGSGERHRGQARRDENEWPVMKNKLEREKGGVYFLRVIERERTEKSVWVRSAVVLINLWQRGFLCCVPWIAALIYMVIFLKTLTAYQALFICISVRLQTVFTLATHISMHKETHTRFVICRKCACMWESWGHFSLSC